MKLIHSEKELLEIIAKYENIVLYGCGRVGKTVCRTLQHHGVEVSCFAISDTGGGITEPVLGLKVKAISDILYRPDRLIIVAVAESAHAEISAMIEQYHGKDTNVVYVSGKLYEYLHIKYRVPLEKLKFSVHITEHCNLNCRGCYHFSPLAEEEYLDINEYKSDLERLSELFGGEMEEIMILGGEPLLHKDIAEILRITRDCFGVGRIKILSNGILLLSMPEEFWNACIETDTELWLTKYPIPVDYEKIEKRAAEFGKTLNWFSAEPVRTLGHQPLDIEGKQDYLKNFNTCYRVNNCIVLACGKMYTCIIPAYIRHFNRYFDKNLVVCEEDYVDIYAVKNKEELLKRLIKPMPFCRYCNRGEIKVFGAIPWEKSRYDITEWTI